MKVQLKCSVSTARWRMKVAANQLKNVVEASRPRVSAAQVARACGVSTATVSYVFNGKPGVSSVVRRQVIEKANELGYRSPLDRKSTRLNSSHVASSYAVFCLQKTKPDRSMH